MNQSETQAETQRAEWAAESETILAMEFDHVSCCHDSTASGQRVLSQVVFHNARKDFAIVIAKKYLELVERKQIETPLDDLTVDDLWIWDQWTVT